MKLSIVFAAVALMGIVILLAACKKRGSQADAETAVAQGDYQFVGCLTPKANGRVPKFHRYRRGIFETTGIRMRLTTPETKEADLAYMTSYNDALYQALKAQGKFRLIEENVARVKANMDETQK